MASISAELRVGGHVFPLLRFTYEVHQATDRRGRVVTKVRFGLVRLFLDVPRTDFLKAWAAAAAQRWAVDLVSLNAATGQALETLHLDGAYCVFYREVFNKGDVHTGSYVLELHLSDPDGFTITAGGPAAYIAPAAREHGTPPVAAVAATLGGVGEVGKRLQSSSKSKLVPSTPEHKAVRWAQYQEEHADNPNVWGEERWSKQYDTNMRNVKVGLGTEDDYRLAFGGVSGTLKTAYTNRQIDIYRAGEQYCGQLKTGKVSLSKQARIDLQKDADLVDNFYQVEYILEKGASKPFLQALERIGATYKIGSQII